jgi:CubicO group peptidase (beta-lactamase class C family)
VPATKIRSPTRTAREKPTVASYGDPDEIRRRRTTAVVSPSCELGARRHDRPAVPLVSLSLIDEWPASHAAAAVLRADGVLASRGPLDHPFRWASVTKLLTATAILVAAEEGIVELDEPAGPPGSTLRHLLAHASGLPFESGGSPIAAPGVRRIYSNAGYDVVGDLLAERAEMSFAEYLGAAVLAPLGMSSTTLQGTPGAGLVGTLADLVLFGQELFAPRLVAGETFAEATTVQFPGLAGVIPGLGRYDPCDWGLGFELRDGKSPHWTGTLNSPGTFGHFGGAGTFLWLDPEAGVALVCLTDLEFGEWAKTAWPALSDAVLAELAG